MTSIKLIRWVYKPEINDDRKCFDKQITNNTHTTDYTIKILNKNRKQLINCIDTDTNEIDMDMFNKIKYNQSLLEICNHKKYCKLWFDVDTFKLEYNEDKIQSLLTDMFDKIDKIFNRKTDINRNKYLVYYKKTNTNYIHSLRIINYGYKIKYEDNKILIHLLKKHNDTDNLFINCLDHKVYHMKRPVILPYNTKPYSKKYKKEDCFKDCNGDDMYKPEESINHYFIDFNYNNTKKNTIQAITPQNYLISLIEDQKLLKIKLKPEDTELIQQKTDILNSEYQDKYKQERPHILLDCDKYTIVDTIINNIDIGFYTENKNKNWWNVLNCLKQLNITNTDRDRFLNYSADNGDLKKYTYKNNLICWNTPLTEENNNELYLYNTIAKILTKNNTTYYYFTDYIKCNVKNITEWIVKKTGLEYNGIAEIFKPLLEHNELDRKQIDKIKMKWKVGKTKYIYDFKSSNLYVGDDGIFNYTIEEEYWKQYEKSIEDKSYDVEVDCITELDTNNKPVMDTNNKPVLNKEINTLVERFIKYEDDNLLVEVECGGGKSYFIQKKIIIERCNEYWIKKLSDKIGKSNGKDWIDILYWCKENSEELKRILMVSCNNSLNKKEFGELKEISNTFTNHLEIQKLDKQIKDIKKLVNESEDYECKECNWVKNNCICDGGCNESNKYCGYEIGCMYCGCKCFNNLKSKKRVLSRYCSMVCSLESIEKYSIGDEWNKDTYTYNINKDECCDLLILDEFNTIQSRFKITQKTFNDLNKSWKHYKAIIRNSKQRLVMDADIKDELLDNFCKICE